MAGLGVFSWIVVGFFAGWLSGMVSRGGPRGCLADVFIGILGGLLGGWFATQELHQEPVTGLVSATIVAFLGATVIRLLLDAVGGGSRRDRGRRDRW